MSAEPSPTREAELHAHYAANALATGHEPSCALVTADENWPTASGRPSCTCRIGGNTPAEQIAWRNAHPGWDGDRQPRQLPADRRIGADLVAELHTMGVTDRIRFLDWLAEHRTSTMRSSLRTWKATRNS